MTIMGLSRVKNDSSPDVLACAAVLSYLLYARGSESFIAAGLVLP